MYLQAPTPFIGSWPSYTGTIAAGSNKSKTNKITKEKGLLVWKKLTIQRSPSSGCNFVDEALSNYDIINWVK